MKKLISKSDRIFIAGASGMVGSSIYRVLKESQYGNKDNGGIIFKPTRKELNLLNHNDVLDWFTLHKPNVVIIATGKGCLNKSK